TVLNDFIHDLQDKYTSSITTEILEEEVINIACLFILFKSYMNINETSSKFYTILQEPNNKISIGFTEAALKLYPTLYGEREVSAGQLGISQNITWGGMWSHLIKYFLNKHDLDIESSEFWNN
ncbi:MAG: hypothetical protein COZ18_16895, partial [Flexibacter sp. CG_4_10_14_3_um_filter_32_15]